MSYLRESLKVLENMFPENVKIAEKSFATIWGGAHLLNMHLDVMKYLLEKSEWHWDFILNLSEAEFPVK